MRVLSLEADTETETRRKRFLREGNLWEEKAMGKTDQGKSPDHAEDLAKSP